MAKTMSATEARAALPEILDRVEAGEEVTITRHGRAVAVVVRTDALRARRADESLATAERLRELVDRSRGRGLPATGALTETRAAELVAELRAARTRS